MEIFIRLAGVQLGPYTEAQVQQHLAEGLLSLTDTAKRDGMSDWAPLSEVLHGSPTPSETSPKPATLPKAAEEEALADEAETLEAPEAPKRAPSAPPGVFHLPTRPQDSHDEPDPTESGGLAKKTSLIEPTAPKRPSSVTPAASSIATTSPLAPVHQATKKVSRAALVKALSQKTSPLPTKAGNAPPRPPVPSSSTLPKPPLSDFPKAPPPALHQSLTAKTVPLHSTPPISPMPITTEPLPTKHFFKPASGSVPPVAAKGAQTDEAKSPEVETVKMPLPPILKSATAPAPHPLPTPEEKSAPQTSDEPTATKSPAPPRRLLPKLIAAWGVLALLILYYVWSPYHAAAALRSALDTGDAAALSAAIDFPAVQDSLKAQINDQVTQSGAPSDMVLSRLNRSVDLYVTPEGISGLMNKADTLATDTPPQPISSEIATKILLNFNSQPVRNEGLASVSDFVVDRGTALLHLQFTGLGWKLKRIVLRPDLSARTSSGAVAPILAPVVDTFLDQGDAKVKSGDAKGALADFTQALAIDPQSSAGYNQRGAVRQAAGDLDGAMSDYSQALTFDPQLAAAYNGRGSIKSAKNDTDGAIADFNQAIHFDPTLATAYDRRGNARIAKDDVDGAIADFTQAIVIDPSMASAYNDRGFARQANSNFDGAIADYTQALVLKPTARTYFNRGLALQAQGNLGAAILDFDHALTLDPKIADAYYYRGNAKSTNHDLDGAIADYTQALSLNPKLASAFGNRGLARQAKGDADGAVADFTQALALDPKIESAYYNRALIEAQKNDLDGAIADTTQALYLDPKNAQAYGTRGFAKLTKGNLDGALADLKQFCDLAPRDHNTDHARLYLWLISKAQNSGADSDQDLSTALSSSWNSSPDDLVTKTASFLLGNMPEATYLTAATSADAALDQAQHCEAWYFAGMKRLLMNDKKGAIDAFRQCVATQQKDYAEYALAQGELQILTAPPVSTKPAAAPPAVAPPKKP